MHVLRSLGVNTGISTAAGLTPANPGGATRTLLTSISRVVLGAAAVWQSVMVLTTLVSLGLGGWPAALAQAMVGAIALLAMRSRRLWRAIPLAMFAAGTLSYVASGDVESSLVFAACWQINFASCFAGLLLLRRSTIGLVAGSALGTAAVIVVFLPDWGVQLPVSIVVTQCSIIIAIRLGIAGLLRHADGVEQSVRAADGAALRNESLRFQSQRLAEDSRVLHDTAINTFAAIASDSTSTHTAARVREQCARDVDLLDALRGTRAREDSARLHDVFTQPALSTRREGIDDSEIIRIESQLSQPTIAAIVGCVREAVTNAAKHSGAPHATVEVTRSATALRIDVSDDGVGFEAGSANIRGIGASILQRAQDHGFTAAVHGTPGAGTRVILNIDLAPPTDDTALLPEVGDPSTSARAVHLRSGAYWGLGVTMVSVVLALAGATDVDYALVPMIGLMFVSLGLTRVPALRRGRVLLPLILSLSTVVVFLLSARATTFGLVGAVHWQALAATGPFVLLLAHVRQRRWAVLAASLWGFVVVAGAAAVLPVSATAAQIVIIAGVVGLGFSSVWALFQGFVTHLAGVEATSRRDALALRLRGAREIAAQEGYRRWMDAGLDSALTLLRGIRDGVLRPEAAPTRAACDEEERYLRQLVQINPELVYLSAVLMPLPGRARERGVPLALRLGDRDAPGEREALTIAELIDAQLRVRPATGTLSATIFPVEGGLRLTLTGPDLILPEIPQAEVHHRRLGTVDLAEITFTPTPSPPFGAESPTTSAERPA
ncbi:hypothetical protein D9V32_04290 [Mycetocola tolaasinivorans]|uniref:histidine kinase n=1 Tax=Mycetocola tolaasinivorans TaxID=76635 RepID=A0A3L7ABV0_9MICO|nr:ATP-binding protein [Mycetocola tolaasinivorans]RLP76862.1 hypothetical protein D9V32_04290 [Mycetocola tolaasinivorans]